MTYWQLLWRVELRALAALIAYSCLMAIYGFLDHFRVLAKGLSPLLSSFDVAWGGFVYSVTFGVVPAILYGAPLYAYLRYKDLASWITVMFVGVVPGIVMYLLGARDFKSDLTGWFVVSGIAVACITHLLSSYGKLQLKDISRHLGSE